MKHSHRVALALVHRNGRWLVARRPEGVHLAGLWEFPGGKIHSGESVADAAVRELEEECGVRAEVQRTLPALTVEYDDRKVELLPVICRWISGEGQALANEECRWVRLGELRKMEMPAVNREILAELTQRA